jgi:3-hydroxybutyryl-CoA dehydrogenase
MECSRREKTNVDIMKVNNIGIVGTGTMGTRIAFRCAVSGLKTFLFDKYPKVVKEALQKIFSLMDDKMDRELLDAETVRSAKENLIGAPTLKEALSDVDLVIENVPENLELKRQVFSDMDQICPAKTILATNSSCIPCSRIAAATLRPGKVINVNFADPTNELDAVEIMKGKQTDKETLLVMERFVKSLGLVPIITLKEIMGFSFNRVWRAIKREALHLVDEGYCDAEDIDRAWMLCFKMSFGPFAFMDAVGLDVIRDIEEQYYLESQDKKDEPPKLLDDMIAKNRLGVKSGRGFYSYPNPAYEDPSWLRKQRQYKERLSVKLGSLE